MTTLIDMPTRLLGVSVAYGLALAVLLSPVVVLLYRRRVSAWMNRPAAGQPPRAPEPVGEPVAEPVAEPPQLASPQLTWRALSLGAAATPAPSAAGVQRRRVLRRILLGWCLGGVANAALMTALLLQAFAQHASATLAWTGGLTFSLPVLANALFLSDFRVRTRVGLFLAGAVGLYLLLGLRGDLAVSLFQGFVLLPVGLLLLLSLRFWCGVAPLVMPIALAAGWLAVAAVELARQAFGAGPEQVWPWRLGGLLLGGWLGVALLRWVQAGYERRRLSDQDIFFDAWWLLYVLVQTVILVLMRRDAFFYLALLGWPLGIALRRGLWALMPLPAPAGGPRHLLLLRVFDDSGRAHRLLEQLEQHWRSLGSVRMIAGRDLALRNLSPADLAAFVSGRLKQRFVGDRSGQSLGQRLQALSDTPDPDGRYRLEHFWCHADAWQPVMRALAAQSHVVLMDLRGFTPQRQGCLIELQHLARTAAHRRVVLLAQDEAQQQALRQLFGAQESTDSPWALVALDAAGADQGQRLFDLLAEPLPAAGPAVPAQGHLRG